MHRAEARYLLPPWPPCLRSSSPSPVTPSLSAGFCLCWLGLPPTSPGLGDRGRTRTVSSHCRSTGRARAPLAEAAARLPRRHPSPCHPSSVGLGSLGGTTECSSQSRPGSVGSQASALFPCQSGRGKKCGYTPVTCTPILPEVCRCHALCEHWDRDESTLGSGAWRGRQVDRK